MLNGKKFIFWKIMMKRFYTNKYVLFATYEIINFDNYTSENKTKHNKNWPYIPDHPYRILIIGGSGSGRKNYY